jgi:hypothetical protein
MGDKFMAEDDRTLGQLQLDIAILKEQLNAAKEALTLSQEILKERLHNMNGHKEYADRQATTFMTKEIYESKHEALNKRISELELSRAELNGKASLRGLFFSYFMGALSLLIGIIELVYRFSK